MLDRILQLHYCITQVSTPVKEVWGQDLLHYVALYLQLHITHVSVSAPKFMRHERN